MRSEKCRGGCRTRIDHDRFAPTNRRPSRECGRDAPIGDAHAESPTGGQQTCRVEWCRRGQTALSQRGQTGRQCRVAAHVTRRATRGQQQRAGRFDVEQGHQRAHRTHHGFEAPRITIGIVIDQHRVRARALGLTTTHARSHTVAPRRRRTAVHALGSQHDESVIGIEHRPASDGTVHDRRDQRPRRCVHHRAPRRRHRRHPVRRNGRTLSSDASSC